MAQLVPVTFDPPGITVRVPADSTVLAAANGAQVDLSAPCGGRGTCGRCAVEVVAGDPPPPDAIETRALRGASADVRLACRLPVAVPMTVRVRTPLPKVEPHAVTGGSPGEALVAAVDLGSTTISAMVLDARSGSALATASVANPQRAYGADVASRLSAALDGSAGALRNRAVGGIAAALSAALGDADASRCRRVVVAGNAVMAHLALGEHAAGLGVHPYEPAFVGARRTDAGAFGLELLNAGCEVAFVPAISGFVGGDVVAGILASDLDRPGGVRALVDLGTNAEIVVSVDGRLTVSSAAAGPAFEAAGLACGGPASSGAIEDVRVRDGDLDVRVIGDGEGRWLCGSGALSLVAALLELGHVDVEGRMHSEGPLTARFHHRGKVRAVQVAGGEGHDHDVFLTQLDVRALQLAKAAVRAGLDLTLAEAGVGWDAVDGLGVAGAFGAGAGIQLLMRIGVVPTVDLPAGVSSLGNSSLAGAALLATDPGSQPRAHAVASGARALDLALVPGFRDAFLAAMAFPAGSKARG